MNTSISISTFINELGLSEQEKVAFYKSLDFFAKMAGIQFAKKAVGSDRQAVCSSEDDFHKLNCWLFGYQMALRPKLPY